MVTISLVNHYWSLMLTMSPVSQVHMTLYPGQWSPLHSTNNDKLILLIHILTAFLLSSSPNMHGVRDVDLSSLLGKHVLTEKYYFHQMVSLSG